MPNLIHDCTLRCLVVLDGRACVCSQRAFMASTRRQLLAECKHNLDAFLNSSSAFRVVRTVPVVSATESTPPSPRTLFILDSSFNPPSRAHASLATSALASRKQEKYPRPHRLLLLFSTFNADKSPAPAAFGHRLAMMIVFAEDLVKRLAKDTDSASGSTTNSSSTSRLRQESQHLNSAYAIQHEAGEDSLAIDIALTTQPYYNDKSDAITSTAPPPYPSNPQHIHITGFDTITRIFAAKYYSKFDPPFSALNSFFDAHGLRVTVRPDEASVDGISVEEQLQWSEKVLKVGELDKEGAKREWSKKVEIVEADEEGKGVSSTKIRKAVKSEDWSEVESLCSPGVASWIKDFGLYSEDG